MIILILGSAMMLDFYFVDIPSGANTPNLGYIYSHHVIEIAAFGYAGYHMGRNLEKEIKKKITVKQGYILINSFLAVTVPLVLMVSLTAMPILAGKTNLIPDHWDIGTILFYSTILGWLPFYSMEGIGYMLKQRDRRSLQCKKPN